MRKAFRSNKIHLGMDEAFGLGLGNYLKKHGLCPESEIFYEHLERVLEISKKYFDSPMIWSDMLFNNPDGIPYYDKFILPQDRVDGAPKDVSLVYWDYYREDFDFTRKEKGGYYLSIEGFNWLIANKAQVVTNAYKIAIERGWYPEKPRFMMLAKEFKPAKMSRRLKSILGVKGTKAERAQSLQNHILSLQGDAESNEELSVLADLLQRTIGYSNFLGEQPMNVE